MLTFVSGVSEDGTSSKMVGEIRTVFGTGHALMVVFAFAVAVAPLVCGGVFRDEKAGIF